jgi:hypothetical protein
MPKTGLQQFSMRHLLESLLSYIQSCPWLWWLGMSESGLSRRAAIEGSIIAKLLPVVIVPLLTAVVTAYVTVQVLAARFDDFKTYIERRVDRIEQHIERREEQQLQNGRVPLISDHPVKAGAPN